MKEQDEVAEFIKENDLEGTPEFRILDLASEIGEIAGDAAKSADYGIERGKLDVKKDELGDALFSLLAVAESLDIDAGEALDLALNKYTERIKEKGDPGSR